MSFRSFGGEFTRTQKISLGGKSRKVESGNETLEKARIERERRKQLKLENKSATTIQAAWRSYASRRATKQQIRSEWMSRYADSNNAAQTSISDGDWLAFSPCIRELCYFIDPGNQQDAAILASVMINPRLVSSDKNDEYIIVARACKLARLCLECLYRHRDIFKSRLAASIHTASTALQQQQLLAASAAQPLIQGVLGLISPDSWTNLQHISNTTAASKVTQHVVTHRAFDKLVIIVHEACVAVRSAHEGASAAESLTTALVVRYCSLPAVIKSEMITSRLSPAVLMVVPLLISKCPSLKPLAGRLWKDTVAALHAMQAAPLAAWLQDTGPQEEGGSATAGAALLGNLLESTEAALKPGADLGALKTAALQFLQLTTTLLTILPLSVFFPGHVENAWMHHDVDDDDHAAALINQTSQQQTRLAWDVECLAPADIMAQLQRLVGDPALLQACIKAALAVSTAAESDALDTESVVNNGVVAKAVCGFIAAVLRLPGNAASLMAISSSLATRLWFSYLRPAQAAASIGQPVWKDSGDDSIDPGWMLPVTLFSEAFSAALVVYGDEGLYDRQQPLALTEVVSVLHLLRMALWHTLWVEAPPIPNGWPPVAAALRYRLSRAAGRLISQLHSRNGRRPFAPASAFHAKDLPVERFQAEIAAGSASGRDSEDPGASRAWGLLAHAPCLLPFKERARVFQAMVSKERAQYQDDDHHAFFPLHHASRQFITVQRGQVLSDAYDAIGTGPNADKLRGRIRIQFISKDGLDEAGVDGGGIFKEFLGEVVKEGFDPSVLGLFKATTDNRLYPNPRASKLVPDALKYLEFLGRMVGKALWEGILLELPLAYFFLKKFRGAVCDVDDLPTLDPELHRHLLSLKSYPGDVADLGLTFTIVSSTSTGASEEIELVPGGRDIAVTASNAAAYIHRVADYRLNVELREPTSAFLRGLHALVPRHWVSMFNEQELQELIGGAEGDNGLDLADLKANVQYSGGYHEEHPVIIALWSALASFNPQEQAEFLRFVTSCPRPPLLGFKYLEPPVCIQMAGSVLDDSSIERLPTASTCMNLLKLPPYKTAEQIRKKLLYATSAGAGFELS